MGIEVLGLQRFQIDTDISLALSPGDSLHVPRSIWHWFFHQMLAASHFFSRLPFSAMQSDIAKDSANMENAVQFLLQQLQAKDAKARASAYMSLQAMQSLNKPR